MGFESSLVKDPSRQTWAELRDLSSVYEGGSLRHEGIHLAVILDAYNLRSTVV